MQAVVGGGGTGLGTVATGIVEGLLAYHPEHDYVHLYPRDDPHQGLSSAWERVRWEQWGLPRRLRQEGRVDLFHSPALCPPLRSPVPVVATVYDFIPLTHPGSVGRGLSALYFTRLLPAALRRADALLCISQHVMEEAQSVLGVPRDRLHLLPMFPSPKLAATAERFVAGPEEPSWERGEVILTYGTHEERKNFAAVIGAYARLPEGLRRRFRLVVAGRTTPHTRELRELARRLGVEGQVDFPGYVEGDRLAMLIARAAAGISLSRAEGFGLIPLELAAFGVPSVVSDIPPHREAYGGLLPLVAPDDVEGASQRLAGLLEGEMGASEMARVREELTSRYNLRRAADACVECYLAVLGKAEAG